VEDIYRPDKVKEAVQVLGADDPAHPSVAYLHNRTKEFYVGGKVQAIQPPTHFDYVALRCKLLLANPPTKLIKTPKLHPRNSELTSKSLHGAK